MEEQKEKKQGHKGKGQKYKSLLIWDILQKRTGKNHVFLALPVRIPSFDKNTPAVGVSTTQSGRRVRFFMNQKLAASRPSVGAYLQSGQCAPNWWVFLVNECRGGS